MEHNGPLALTIGVIQQALDDWARPKPRDVSQWNIWARERDDANDFLVSQLWEKENLWGTILREHGLAPYWKAGLIQTMRKRRMHRGDALVPGRAP